MSELTLKVSVIMPVFNSEKHLDQAVESLLNQSLTEFELIVVNDGSTDGSLRRIERWANQDERIRVINLDSNQGVSACRNRGISEARATHIALLDSDDTWHADKLLVQHAYHQKTGCSISCTAFWFGKKIINSKALLTYADLLANNLVNTSSVMINTDIIAVRFSTRSLSEDYRLWLQITRDHPIHFIQKPLVVRSVFDGLSANKIMMAKQRWHIYREVEHLSVAHSLYYVFCYTVTGAKKYWKVL
jgi:teichuronic acid biosynthesis glycosyltransferase TuaG